MHPRTARTARAQSRFHSPPRPHRHGTTATPALMSIPPLARRRASSPLRAKTRASPVGMTGSTVQMYIDTAACPRRTRCESPESPFPRIDGGGVTAAYDPPRLTWPTSTYTYHNITASMTTACDGHPRVVGDLTTLATGTSSSLTTSEYLAGPNFTKPTPSCTMAPPDCAQVTAEYEVARTNSYCSNTQDLDCGKCTINGGTVKLSM